jgi:hypothetical protein
VGRTVEAELVSGVELGDWRDRVLMPHDVPCFVTAEGQIAWGGINSASHREADLVAERRRQDMRGKGLGLICRFVAALRERGVPMLTNQPVARLALALSWARGSSSRRARESFWQPAATALIRK